MCLTERYKFHGAAKNERLPLLLYLHATGGDLGGKSEGKNGITRGRRLHQKEGRELF